MSTDRAQPADSAMDRLEPVTPGERIITLDILRGLALLGVVIANVWLGFSGAVFLPQGMHEQLAGLTLDAVVGSAIGVFVSGKAATTFAFLFGLGFAVQLMRAEARGQTGVPAYGRRLAVLLLFGLAHAILLWHGDVLTAYALGGFVLLLFRKRSDRTLLVWAGVLLVAVPLLLGATPLLLSLAGSAMPQPDPAMLTEMRASALAAFRSGDPAQVISQNLTLLQLIYASPKAFWLLMVLGVLLLGLHAGRRRFFENVEMHRAGFRRMALWGFAVGLPGSGALAVLHIRFPMETITAEPRLMLLSTALGLVGTLPLAFGYIATATLQAQRAEWRRRFDRFAAVGRMALTNYLTQTVLGLLIFYGYGGGLIGQVGAAVSLLIATAIFALQMMWSPWWLARFRFGPVEWVWRSLTYGRAQPMRIGTPVRPHIPSTV